MFILSTASREKGCRVQVLRKEVAHRPRRVVASSGSEPMWVLAGGRQADHRSGTSVEYVATLPKNQAADKDP